jgi:hypothetical protein
MRFPHRRKLAEHGSAAAVPVSRLRAADLEITDEVPMSDDAMPLFLDLLNRAASGARATS